ncbi:MAG: MFS transporter [Chloroflexota bacterium]
MNNNKAKLGRPPAHQTYLIMRSTTAFAFSLIITYELVYHTVEIGLTPLQLVAVGVVLEAMTFFFEIPTGIIADAYSRRLSVLIGLFLFGSGFLVEGLVATFDAVLMAQVLWGIGFTFYSGAEAAWLTDEVGEERAGQLFLRATQIGQVARLIGIGVGAWLVTYGLRIPIVVGSVLYILLALFLTWAMSETGFQPSISDRGQGVLARMSQPFREGVTVVKARPMLVRILLVGIVIGLCIGGFDRLDAAHFTENFVFPRLGTLEPLAWFSVLAGVIALLSLIGAELARIQLTRHEHTSIAKLLFGLYSGMVLCLIVFVLSRWFIPAAICYCISQSLRNVGRPLLIVWINQNAPSAVRATVISMYWQSNALGQIVGSPIVGWIGSVFSLRMALMAATIVYTAVLPLLRIAAEDAEVAKRGEETC